ncbi:MAG TPA: hypothetical protein PLA50_09365, partial [Bacteroidia bacterium]|nr:hypothetical protein [Bacteroidia bacterium]
AFAALPSERLSRVEAVVWAISSRDLLLPELPARRAGIEWRPVSLRTGDAPPVRAGSGGQELIATLKELSSIDDPRQTPYAEAIVSALFETDDGTEHCVFLWAFRDRKLEPAAKLGPGLRYRLRTVPLESETAANRATRLDDFFRQDLEPGFAAEFEKVE